MDDSMPVNGRKLTNIGTFRMYVVEYLKRHPQFGLSVYQSPSGDDISKLIDHH